MHMRHHVTNHLIISNDKDSNSENRINYASVTVARPDKLDLTSKHADPLSGGLLADGIVFIEDGCDNCRRGLREVERITFVADDSSLRQAID
jgi:hypothetical protein